MDKGSIGGVILAIFGIMAGLWLEGGKISQILQPTAALIVFGGTMGAVLLQFPLSTVTSRFPQHGARIYCSASSRTKNSSQLLISFANKARRDGVVSLDADLDWKSRIHF